MLLNPTYWHVRWFHFVQSNIGNGEYSKHERFKAGTNLCHFMRVCFLWPLLVAVFLIGSSIFVLFGLIFLSILIPWDWWGIYGLLIAWAAIIGTPICIYIAAVLFGKYGKGPLGGIAHCAYEHAKAIKGRFCPIVKFE